MRTLGTMAVGVLAIALAAGCSKEKDASPGGGPRANRSGSPPQAITLVQAIEKRDLAAAKARLDEGEDVNRKVDRFGTPLMLAAHRNNYEMIHLLLDAGADPNDVNANGSAPLHLMVLIGDPMSSKVFDMKLAVIRKLMDAGADPRLANQRGKTPIGQIESFIETARTDRHRQRLRTVLAVLKKEPAAKD